MKLDFPLSSERNILLYYIYCAIWGMYPINAIVSLFFLSRGLTFAEIGIVVAVFQITAILFEVPTGYIADKLGRRLSVIVGLVLLIVVAWLWIFAHNYLQFAGLAAIWMLGFTCISGSFEAYIYDHLKEKSLLEHYDKVISKSTAIAFFTGAIGSIIGTWLYSVKPEYVYYAQIATFTTCLFTVMAMTNDKVKNSTHSEASKVHLLAGIKRISSSKQLLWITIFISGFYAFFMYFINSLNSPYLLAQKVFDVKYLGIFFAAMAVYQAFLSDQFAKIKKRLSDTALILTLTLIQIAALLGLSYFFGLVGIFSYILFVTIEPFEGLLINSFAQKYAESETRATTISTIKMFNSVFAAGVGILAGKLFDHTGMQAGFLFVAVILGVFAFALITVKRLRNIEL